MTPLLFLLKGPILAQHRIYLDTNSTAPLLPAVKEALTHELERVGNPSSQHTWGRDAKATVEAAREKLAFTLDAHPDYIIFTSGGTEANNKALRAAPWQTILVSSMEHDSVQKAPEEAHLIPLQASGLLDLEALESALSQAQGLTLVSTLLASNETGVIQPLQEITRLARRYGALVHTDATQAFGRIPLSFREL